MGALVGEMRRWEDPAHRFPVDDIDPESGRRAVTISVVELTPTAWGPMLGGFLHDCRSALDLRRTCEN